MGRREQVAAQGTGIVRRYSNLAEIKWRQAAITIIVFVESLQEPARVLIVMPVHNVELRPLRRGVTRAYQVMPYMEGQNLWSHASDLVINRDGPAEAICPSRRSRTLHTFWVPVGEMLSDYSGNGGDTSPNYEKTWNTGLTPMVLSATDVRNRPIRQTGVIITQDRGLRNTGRLRNPLIAMKRIEDGSSHTMLVAEKYVPSNAYQGGSWGDNFPWTRGSEWEGVRFAYPYNKANPNELVRNDTPVNNPLNARGELACNCYIFGSAHSGAFNAAFCDGSVRTIGYDIEAVAFQRFANRFDGQVMEGSP